MASVERLWCAAGFPLPLQPRVLDLVGIDNGKPEVLRPDAEFLLLDLKVSPRSIWLDKALERWCERSRTATFVWRRLPLLLATSCFILDSIGAATCVWH